MEQIPKILKFDDFTWGELRRMMEKAGVKDNHKIHCIDIDCDSDRTAVLTVDDDIFLTNYPNM